MNNQYYRDPARYRSHSPNRRRSSPLPLPMPMNASARHYSPPRNSRPRTPRPNPRQLTPPLNDRRTSDYSGYPDHQVPRSTRSLPWQSQAPVRPPSPRQEWRERSGYRNPSPRSASRAYEYSSSREEMLFTQPQYPSYPSRPSPAVRSEQRSSQVIDVDSWSPSQYRAQPSSTYYSQSTPQSYNRPNSTRGSRESPICLDDYEPSPSGYYNRTSDRWKNVRESGVEKLIHEEYRPPPRPRTPPDVRRSWEDARQRRPEPVQRPASPPRQERRENRHSFGENWIHPDRRGYIDNRKDDERYATQAQPSSYRDPAPTSFKTPPQASPALIQNSFDNYSRYQGPDRAGPSISSTNRSDNARRDSLPPRVGNSYEARGPPPFDPRAPTPRTPSVPSRSNPPKAPDAVQLPPILPRSSQQLPPPTQYQTPGPPQPPNPSTPMQTTAPRPKESRWDKGPTQVKATQPRTLDDDDEALRLKRLKAKKLKQAAKSQKPQTKPPIPPVNRSFSEPSKSLTAFTTGERNQLINQMAKHAAELVFAPKSPPAPIPQAASMTFVTPPGLNMLKGNEISPSPAAVPPPGTPPISAEQWKNQIAAIKAQLSKKNDAATAVTNEGPMKTDTSTQTPPVPPQGFMKVPGIDVTPTTPGSTPQKAIVVELPEEPTSLNPPHLSKPDDQPRKRGTSITSSNSSTKSTSPFLSAPLTSGNCVVCSAEDLPPVNRLAKCTDCGDPYHQSCHNPPLTKAILEEAAENWTCKKCKEKLEGQQSNSSRFPLRARKVSRLSVTYKRYDAERTLEESVKMNKSSLTALLQRHAEWKSPTQGKSPLPAGSTSDGVAQRRVVTAPSTTIPKAKVDGDNSLKGDSARQMSIDGSEVHAKTPAQQDSSVPNDTKPIAETAVETTKIKETLSIERTVVSVSEPTLPQEPAPPALKELKEISQLQTQELEPSQREEPFQEASSGEAIPSVKPRDKVIPASQPSDSSQQAPQSPQTENKIDLVNPEVSPIVRPRHRSLSKRGLVISDSEEETSPKRIKTVEPTPRKAAMKSAPSSRFMPANNVATKSAPSSGAKGAPPGGKWCRKSAPSSRMTVAPLVNRDDTKTSSEVARKSSVVARKSGSKARLQTPVSEQSDTTAKRKETNVAPQQQERDLNTPVSPAAHGIRLFPRPPSPLPATRPTDPGESQRYSLKLILMTGSNKNEPLVLDNEPAGFDFSTPYPVPLSRIQPTPIPQSPKQKRIKDKKNNFDILSLVPRDAVPVLEDGKLAFRDGTIDPRTGNLKRGARKFKVGRIVPGELL